MSQREEMIAEVQKQFEDEFFKENGFIMNSKQKRAAKKQIEKLVDRRLKSIERLSL